MLRITLLALALAACGGSSKPATPVTPPATPMPSEGSAAETAPASDPGSEVLAQAALAEQYDAGKKIYTAKGCASCHGDHGEGNPKNPAVIGEGALPAQPPKGARLRTTTFSSAGDVLAFVKAKMPIKSPGSLSDDDAAAVTAWMLSESKVNITQKLDATNAASLTLR